jgi:cell division cycle 14
MQDLVYEGFFEDFGPLNLAKIWKYINEVYKFLNDEKFATNTFYHYTSPHYTKCTNSALLVCCYCVRPSPSR